MILMSKRTMQRTTTAMKMTMYSEMVEVCLDYEDYLNPQITAYNHFKALVMQAINLISRYFIKVLPLKILWIYKESWTQYLQRFWTCNKAVGKLQYNFEFIPQRNKQELTPNACAFHPLRALMANQTILAIQPFINLITGVLLRQLN